MKKVLKFGFFLVLLLLVAGLVAGPVLFSRWISPDSIVRRIESNLNCRAFVENVEVQIFRRPSRIVLQGLALGPRDAFALQKTPLAQRAPMQETISHCESVTLEMRLGSLAARKIDVERFVISHLNIQMLLKEDGTNSFLTLFETPDGAGKDAPEVVDGPPRLQEGGGRPFRAGDLPLSMYADAVELDGGTIYATIEKNGSMILVDEIQLLVSNIDIDAADLARHNEGAIDLSMLVGVDSPPEKGERYAEFRFSGSGLAHPFDAETGALDPSVVADLTIAEGSYIDASPTLEAVAGLLKELGRFGVKVGEIDLSGDFEEPAETRLEYAEGILRILKETRFNTGDYALVLAPESWLDANTNQHDFQGSVVASAETTAEAIAEVDEWLKEKAGSMASESVRDMLLSPVMQEGRIRLGFRSSGDMDEPKVDLVTRLGSVSDILGLGNADSLESLKAQGKQLLEGLKGLFKRPEPPPPAPPDPSATPPAVPAEPPGPPAPNSGPPQQNPAPPAGGSNPDKAGR